MMTVNEVSKLAGVSIRTLQYYDKIGLLKPAKYTGSGYRLYDETDIEKLQQILLFRELEFPLKQIKDIISNPSYDKNRALEQQITLLKMKKEHLEKLIDFARGIQLEGVKTMDFTVFDTSKMDEYARQAREQWGGMQEFQEFERKAQGRTKEADQAVIEGFRQLFAEFGQMKMHDPGAEPVQTQVRKLQDYITDHFYRCPDEVLFSLGRMYVSSNEFTENINKMGGEGTAGFVSEAIRIYCGK